MAARKSRGNITFTLNSVNITQYCTSTSLKAAANKLEVTSLAATAKEFIADDTDWSVDVQANWDNALDNVLGPLIVTPGTKVPAVLAIAGSTATVTYTWAASGGNGAEVTDYSVDAGAGEVLASAVTISMSGAPTRTTA